MSGSNTTLMLVAGAAAAYYFFTKSNSSTPVGSSQTLLTRAPGSNAVTTSPYTQGPMDQPNYHPAASAAIATNVNTGGNVSLQDLQSAIIAKASSDPMYPNNMTPAMWSNYADQALYAYSQNHMSDVTGLFPTGTNFNAPMTWGDYWGRVSLILTNFGYNPATSYDPNRGWYTINPNGTTSFGLTGLGRTRWAV